MLIVHVVRYWPTLTETFVRDEIADLAVDLAGRAEVVVLALGDRGDPHAPPAELEGVRVIHRPTRWGWVSAAPILTWGMALVARGWFSARFGRARRQGREARGEALRRGEPPPSQKTVDRTDLWLAARLARADCVHVHFAGEAAVRVRDACVRAGTPFSVSVHAVDLFRPHPRLADVLRDAAWVRTICEAHVARLQAVVRRDVAVIRCGVERPMRALAATAAPVVLAVGRNVPKKGFALLVDAARELPGEVEVRIVSDLAEPASGAGNVPGARIVHLGMRPHADVLARIAGARVLCVPSVVAPDGDADGIPVVILEALAAGVPVVASAISGIPEVVDDAVGWLVPPGDMQALVAALRHVLDDPAEAARRGARGPDRLRARGFDRATRRAALAEQFIHAGTR